MKTKLTEAFLFLVSEPSKINLHFQIICDGARLYAHKVQSILERNCYFDNHLNAEFDVNDRVREMQI